jgi:hypothetical protein
MRAVSTAALITAWEEGMGEPAVDQAPALLRSLRLAPAGCDPADMTVGTCDLLLFDLRGFLFGPDFALVATCPACGEPVEVVIPASAVVPAPPATPARHVTLDTDGLSIRCRVPTNSDLRALAAIGPGADVTDLLARCVEQIDGPHAPATAALPPPVAERVADALAASDPGAEVSADLACPCGTQWPETIDIRSILWTELTTWAQRRMAEVHQLASAYGWSERDILEMSPYRRRFYLESCHA